MVTASHNPPQDNGYKVGFFKPLGKQPTTVGGKVVDADAQFLKEALHLAEPLEHPADLARRSDQPEIQRAQPIARIAIEHRRPVDEQRGGAVVIVRRDAEDRVFHQFPILSFRRSANRNNQNNV